MAKILEPKILPHKRYSLGDVIPRRPIPLLPCRGKLSTDLEEVMTVTVGEAATKSDGCRKGRASLKIKINDVQKQICKLRQLNQLRHEFRLESDSNHQLIDFFDLNSSSKSESLWQNQLYCIQIWSKYLKSIKRDQKRSKIDWIWSNLVEFSWNRSKKLIELVFFNIWSNLNKNWLKKIKFGRIQTKRDQNRNWRCNFDYKIQIVI